VTWIYIILNVLCYSVNNTTPQSARSENETTGRGRVNCSTNDAPRVGCKRLY